MTKNDLEDCVRSENKYKLELSRLGKMTKTRFFYGGIFGASVHDFAIRLIVSNGGIFLLASIQNQFVW